MNTAFFTSRAPLPKPARKRTTSIAAIAGLLALGLPAPAAVAATLPSLSVSDMTVRETDAASTVADVRVVLSKTVSHKVSVRYETVDGTAKSPSDFRYRSGRVFFPAGVKAKRVAIPLTGDTRDEANETFRLRILDPVHAKIADRSGTVTIRDNDPMPSMSIGDVTVTEEDSADNTPMNFPVRLSTASGLPITVDYRMTEGSATWEDDYLAESSGDVYFPPGSTTKYIGFAAVGDNKDEVDETFTVTLSNAENARLSHSSAVGKICDNDGPDISIENTFVREGHTATFEVELSKPSKQDVKFDYETEEGSAHSPADFEATSGTKTIPAGEDEVRLKVWTRDDHKDEVDETFSMNISDVKNAKIDDGHAYAKIDDDDGPKIWVEKAFVDEGRDAHFKVKLSDRSPQDITFEYFTRDGTAKAPDDYWAVSGHKTIRHGDDVWITVPTKQDATYESDETFYLNISHVRDARLVDGRATGTIRDDDPAPPTQPKLSIGNGSATEGSPVEFTLSLDKTSAVPVSVTVTTNDDSATKADNDYTAPAGTFTIPANQLSAKLLVSTGNDSKNEPNETFTVHLSNPVNATLQGTGVAVGTINDNDPPPGAPAQLSISNGSAPEGSPVEFTLTLDKAVSNPVTVSVATNGNTASKGTDFTPPAATFTIPANQLSAKLLVPTVNDTDKESTETFTVHLSSPVNSQLQGNGIGVGTITDND